jgi:integrase
MATISLAVLSARPTSDSKYPIQVRIASKRQKVYIKTSYLLDDLSQWHDGKVVARNDAAMMNKRLIYELKKYSDRLKFIENSDCYTATQLRFLLTQEDRVSRNIITFNDFFRQRMKDFEEEGRNSYAKMHADTLRVFEMSEGEIPLPGMNHTIIDHFNRYMIKKGYSDGNRQMRLCHIKARINDAIKNGLLKFEIHPFAYTKLPTPEPKDLDISITEFRRIVNADLSKSKRLTLARDMFLLSFYLGGINFADIVRVDFSTTELSYVRQKSGAHKRKDKTTKLSIPDEILPITSKYIGDDGKLNLGYNYTYHNLCSYINSCLKLLAKELNIRNNLTFYSARKTFAQFASEIGIPYPIIEYCLGHSIKTGITINSYVKVKPNQADSAIRRVIEYTKNPDVFKEYINLRAQMQMMMM